MAISRIDAMHDALTICGGLGFEMVPGFSTHWPMAAETLIQLGHPEIVHEWATSYPLKRKHLPMPDPVEAIDAERADSWRAALGDFRRASDWRQYFERSLEERPWTEVLAGWWPRLIPGMASGLTHGLIRTMHAVRSIQLADAGPSKAQLRELANGLGYWASLYIEQPGPHGLLGDAALPELLADVPRIGRETKISTRDRGLFRHMPTVARWGEIASRLASPSDVETALSDMTLAFTQVVLVHDREFPIPLLHTVSAPAAIRVMLPHIPSQLHVASYLAVWEATAAILTNFSGSAKAEELLPDAPGEPQSPPAPDELIARAVAHGDEHAIKFTEACLREYARRPDSRYLLAPARIVPKLLRYFR
jgi:hypothetical protein